MFSPRLASSGTQAGGGVCPVKGGGRVFCPGCPGEGGGGRGGLVLPRILITCPGSQGTLLGPPGCAQNIPLLEPGSPRFFWWYENSE